MYDINMIMGITCNLYQSILEKLPDCYTHIFFTLIIINFIGRIDKLNPYLSNNGVEYPRVTHFALYAYANLKNAFLNGASAFTLSLIPLDILSKISYKTFLRINYFLFK